MSSGKDNKIICWNPNDLSVAAEIVYEIPCNHWCFDIKWCLGERELDDRSLFISRSSSISSRSQSHFCCLVRWHIECVHVDGWFLSSLSSGEQPTIHASVRWWTRCSRRTSLHDNTRCSTHQIRAQMDATSSESFIRGRHQRLPRIEQPRHSLCVDLVRGETGRCSTSCCPSGRRIRSILAEQRCSSSSTGDHWTGGRWSRLRPSGSNVWHDVTSRKLAGVLWSSDRLDWQFSRWTDSLAISPRLIRKRSATELRRAARISSRRHLATRSEIDRRRSTTTDQGDEWIACGRDSNEQPG